MKTTLSLVALLLVLFVHRADAQRAGTLDAAFNGGRVLVDRTASECLYQVVLQPDGKLLALAEFYDFTQPREEVLQYRLLRLHANGSVDRTFGEQGFVKTDNIQSVVVRDNGKIAAASLNNGALEVVQYNANGSVDYTFKKITVSDAGSCCFAALMLQADGDLVATAACWEYKMVNVNPTTWLPDSTTANSSTISPFFRYEAEATNMVVLRCSADGAVENRITTHYNKPITPYDLDMAADGKLVLLAAEFNYPGNSYLARFDADGNVDKTFGMEGEIILPQSTDGLAQYTELAVQPDGKVIAAGSVLSYTKLYPVQSYMIPGSSLCMVRYNDDGSMDAGFGDGGMQRTGIDTSALLADIAVQTDGKIVLAGSAGKDNYIYDFAVARYHENGTLDYTFGNGGIVTTDIALRDISASMALQPNGNMVVAGSSAKVNAFGTIYDHDIALVRYHGASGAPIPDAAQAPPLSILSTATGDQQLQYNLTEAGNITLQLYDLSGRLVHTLATNEPRSAGANTETVRLDNSLSSGMYLLLLTTSEASSSTWIVKR